MVARFRKAILRWARTHFGGMERREAWGYGVWLSFAALVLVFELWAAIWGDSASWPTISATVGDLEYHRPYLALIVVGVLVLFAYSAFRFPAAKTGVLPAPDVADGEVGGFAGDELLPSRTALGGRLTRSKTPVRELAAGVYFAIAVVVIIVATVVAALTSDSETEFGVGRTLYGLIAFFWVIVPALLAWPKRFAVDIPFLTLFETIRSLERRLRVVALAFAVGLVILLIHLVLYPWPSIIPDLSRLHQIYKCHPVEAANHPLSAQDKARCKKLDESQIEPAPTSP